MNARLLLRTILGLLGLSFRGDEGLLDFVWVNLSRLFPIGFGDIVLRRTGLDAYEIWSSRSVLSQRADIKGLAYHRM